MQLSDAQMGRVEGWVRENLLECLVCKSTNFLVNPVVLSMPEHTPGAYNAAGVPTIPDKNKAHQGAGEPKDFSPSWIGRRKCTAIARGGPLKEKAHRRGAREPKG